MAAGELHVVTGAAGFIGRWLVKALIESGASVFGCDNFSRGSEGQIAEFRDSGQFQFVEADLKDPRACGAVMNAVPAMPAVVWHLAANSDIAAGVADSAIDLGDTFLTTFHTLGAMRERGWRRIAFASSSAVYGTLESPIAEDAGPLFPISNYGAMKLASEAAISAACETFLEQAWIFRFPNVAGAYATHGALYDFVRKLRHNPRELEVLGDGEQAKPYLGVEELIGAMLFIREHGRERLNYFNIGPADSGLTVREMAEATVRVAAPGARIRYTGGEKGWAGDVPRFAYSVRKLEALGWRARHTSREAVEAAIPLVWAECRQ